ncbi:MAG: DNA translocase FtsK 4TM domain-containing protein [Magnetococcales bacterium]|nr:DNA translocase FtsK 4TM domain-containing protein [Magnetococcales bacterium]MBF0115690.1 DNA translocase FtsK 4TM domain-containing protein [Magnetococcales bacterium]
MAARNKQSESKPAPISWSRLVLFEALGIALIAVAIFVLLTLISFHPDDPSFNQTGGEVVRNAAGLSGAYLSEALLQIFGYASAGVVILFGMIGFLLFRNITTSYWDRVVAMILLLLTSSIFLALMWEKGLPGGLPAGPGGIFGMMGAELLRRWLGPVGVMVLLLPLVLLSLMVVIRFSLWEKCAAVWRMWQGWQVKSPVEREVAPVVMVEPEFDPQPVTVRKKGTRKEEKAEQELPEQEEMAVHHHEQQAEVETEEMRRERKLSGQSREVVSGPMAVRHSRWKRMRPVVMTQLRQGLEVTEQRLRQAWEVFRLRLGGFGVLPGKWGKSAAEGADKGVAAEAEPNFFVAAAGREVRFEGEEAQLQPVAPLRTKPKLSMMSQAVLAAHDQAREGGGVGEPTLPPLERLEPLATVRVRVDEVVTEPPLTEAVQVQGEESAIPVVGLHAEQRHEPCFDEPEEVVVVQHSAGVPSERPTQERVTPSVRIPLAVELWPEKTMPAPTLAAPTLAPTQPPTEAPTQPPTEAATEEPTQPPTEAPFAAVTGMDMHAPLAEDAGVVDASAELLTGSPADEGEQAILGGGSWEAESDEVVLHAEESVQPRMPEVGDLADFTAFAAPAVDRQALIREMDAGQDEAVVEAVVEEESLLPPFSIMVDAGPQRHAGPAREALQQIARTLEQKLADFKIKGQIVDVLPGPVVTTFELDLAPGVRAAKVIGLSDDLARSISVSSVRVVGNVPGKTVIGIEIPNEVRQTVYLKEILTSENFRKTNSPLAVALGSDIFGNPVVGNLAKMPHLLVAGTTGSGKSVAVNAMICSILFTATPKQVRFLMVDPKMLELSIYEGIPHLLAPVVTDVGKAANLLKWAVSEMENRYRLMSELGVRNLAGYNERILQCIEQDEQPMRRVKIGFDPETGRPVEQEEPIPLDTKPLVVIVIDELADLMIQVGKEVEPAIARLAQMARAAGLHLVLATQRPSVDVITGLIKANFPTRLAFQVSSKIDSRTILDAMGADRLLGMGDGLFLPPGTSHLQRIHAPFVSDREVHDLVKYLRSTGAPDYDHSVLIQRGDGDDGDEGYAGGAGGDEQDELYDQAVRIVLRERKVSTSMIQRVFKIGYNRAARMVEQMESEGLISPPNGAGKREVLAPES